MNVYCFFIRTFVSAKATHFSLYIITGYSQDTETETVNQKCRK